MLDQNFIVKLLYQSIPQLASILAAGHRRCPPDLGGQSNRRVANPACREGAGPEPEGRRAVRRPSSRWSRRPHAQATAPPVPASRGRRFTTREAPRGRGHPRRL